MLHAAANRKFHAHWLFLRPPTDAFYYHPRMHAGCLHFHHCRVNIKFRAARCVMKLFFDSSQKRWAKWKASKMQCYAATEASLVHSVCIPRANVGAKKSESNNNKKNRRRRRLFYLSRFLSLNTPSQCTVAVLPDRVKTALGGGGSRPLVIGVFEGLIQIYT